MVQKFDICHQLLVCRNPKLMYPIKKILAVPLQTFIKVSKANRISLVWQNIPASLVVLIHCLHAVNSNSRVIESDLQESFRMKKVMMDLMKKEAMIHPEAL